jgi:1-acyl-sn-glycerol-3-phosphate acyltransferase
VARWPVVGSLCKVVDTLFVDRRRKADLPRVLEHARRARPRPGHRLLPEGTTSKGDALLPFRASLLDLPASLGLPVWAAAIGYQTGPGDPPAHEAVCWWGRPFRRTLGVWCGCGAFAPPCGWRRSRSRAPTASSWRRG